MLGNLFKSRLHKQIDQLLLDAEQCIGQFERQVVHATHQQRRWFGEALQGAVNLNEEVLGIPPERAFSGNLGSADFIQQVANRMKDAASVVTERYASSNIPGVREFADKQLVGLNIFYHLYLLRVAECTTPPYRSLEINRMLARFTNFIFDARKA